MFSGLVKKFQKYLPWLILMLGIGLRFTALGIVPEGCAQDEAYAAWNAFSLYHDGIDSAGHSFPVYFEAWGHGQSAMLTYMILPFIVLLKGHVSLLAIRLPQAIVAVFTLGAVYFLLRELYGVRTACWGMFLLAICPWHVMVSRWGLDANLAPGFLMFGLACFVYGLRKPPFLALAGLFYGLSLYCYALMWLVVPVIVLLQGIYCFCYKKLKFSGWLLAGILIVAVMAFPLIAFLLVNNGYLPDFQFGPFSVYKMTSLRQNEFAGNLRDIIGNIKNTVKLFYYQDSLYAYDVIHPFGFFYRIGRVFVIGGLLVLLFRIGKSFLTKSFCFDFFILVQLIGAGLIGALVFVDISRINCAYIPFVLCETIGVSAAIGLLSKYRERLGAVAAVLLVCIYLVETVSFQRVYYTDYREKSSGWFYKGADEAVRCASKAAADTGREIQVQTGLHYPNILLTTETSARRYLESVVYSVMPPTPSEFTADGVVFHMGIDKENITPEYVYIFIEPDYDKFSGFQIEQFTHWYVAY